MQQDAAAGTEFQSRLGEDAERQARSAADADDQAAKKQAPMAVQATQVLTPQEARPVVQVLEQGAARSEQKALPQQVRALSAPPILQAARAQEQQLPAARAFFLPAEVPQHADATVPAPQAY